MKNKTEQIEFLKRHLAYFNTHPYMASWIIGAAIKMEHQSLPKQEIESAQIDHFKERMSSVVAAVGDQMFWGQIKPISAMIGLLLSIYFHTVGIIVFFVIYNIAHIYVRIHGLISGYKNGTSIINRIGLKNYKPIINRLNRAGGFLIGFSLIFIINSNDLMTMVDVIAFLCGIVFMFALIKLKLAVPWSLIVLILSSSIIGVFIR